MPNSIRTQAPASSPAPQVLVPTLSQLGELKLICLHVRKSNCKQKPCGFIVQHLDQNPHEFYAATYGRA